MTVTDAMIAAGVQVLTSTGQKITAAKRPTVAKNVYEAMRPLEPAAVVTTASATYTADTTSIIANPERGFTGVGTQRHNGTTLTEDVWQMDDGAGEGANWRVIRVIIRLDDFRATNNLPVGLLNFLNNTFFPRLRTDGLKVGLRFVYNNGKQADNVTNGPPYADTTKARMIGHIGQLASTIAANVDVIAFFEHGFLGGWGEMHNGDKGPNVPDYTGRNEVWDAIVAAVPTSRMILIRYPWDLRVNHGAALTVSGDAYNGSKRSRTGSMNDSYGASANDWWTYEDSSGFTMAEDKAYLATLTTHAPCVAEVANQDLGEQRAPLELLNEAASFHLAACTGTWPPEVMGEWKGTAYGGSSTIYAEFNRRMGYRFEVQSATFTSRVIRSGKFSASVSMINRGFAAPYNERPAFFVLTKASPPYKYRVPITGGTDLRWALSGNTFSLSVTGATLPSNLPTGTLSLHLEMPDLDVGLREDPRYSILCANTGMRDAATGLNLLSSAITSV